MWRTVLDKKFSGFWRRSFLVSIRLPRSLHKLTWLGVGEWKTNSRNCLDHALWRCVHGKLHHELEQLQSLRKRKRKRERERERERGKARRKDQRNWDWPDKPTGYLGAIGWMAFERIKDTHTNIHFYIYIVTISFIMITMIIL